MTSCAQIESDASQYPADAKEHERHNEQIIAAMHIEELRHVEDELNVYEKVPLLFLLCADTLPGAKYLLQRLIVNFHTASADMTPTNGMLHEWARTTPEWPTKLVEALAIVRSDTILRRFGLNLDCIHTRFLPHRPDCAVRVHPLLKCLVYVCEQLCPDETRLLIDAVCAAHPAAAATGNRLLRTVPTESAERYLELWLLLWMSEGVIGVGDYAPGAETRRRVNHCDVNAVLSALAATKRENMVAMGEKLRSEQIAFNFTTEGIIHIAQKKVTGDGGSADDGLAQLRAQMAANMTANTAGRVDANNAADDNDDDRYTVRSTHAGFALIIDQETFHRTEHSAEVREPLRRRSGTISDRLALVLAFAGCGYVCEERGNLTAAEIEAQIEEIVRRSSEKGCDSLVVCILSHGFRGHVYGADTVPVSLERIESLMADARLVRKPKLLVVQACQGEQVQELVYGDEEVLATDGPTAVPLPPPVRSPVSQSASMRAGDLKMTDICVALATMPGFVSYRNTCSGTWFIQSLCKAIGEHSKRMHITDILTKVNNSVTKSRGPEQQSMVPRFESSLRKQFYLPQLRTFGGASAQ